MSYELHHVPASQNALSSLAVYKHQSYSRVPHRHRWPASLRCSVLVCQLPHWTLVGASSSVTYARASVLCYTPWTRRKYHMNIYEHWISSSKKKCKSEKNTYHNHMSFFLEGCQYIKIKRKFWSVGLILTCKSVGCLFSHYLIRSTAMLSPNEKLSEKKKSHLQLNFLKYPILTILNINHPKTWQGSKRK